jgi:flagellar basal-body rod protein FlgC
MDKLFWIFLSSFICSLVYAGDPLRAAIDKAAAANKVQSQRIKMISENITNESSTADKPGQKPYTRQVMFIKNKYDKNLRTKKLVVARKALDAKTPYRRKYEPSHPAADMNGYVKYPNVDKVIERLDASEAQRSYEANLSLIEVSKAMIRNTIDMIK